MCASHGSELGTYGEALLQTHAAAVQYSVSLGPRFTLTSIVVHTSSQPTLRPT
jgi:hypothetical protein